MDFDGNIELRYPDGKVVSCDVLFKTELNGKVYVTYTDYTKNKDDILKVYSSLLVKEGDQYKILPAEDMNDLREIQKDVDEYYKLVTSNTAEMAKEIINKVKNEKE